MTSKRHCGYCGIEKSHPVKPEERCKCAYRYGKRQKGFKGGFMVECSNITTETTLQEMLDSIKETLSVSLKTNPNGTWKWSFSSRGDRRRTGGADDK